MANLLILGGSLSFVIACAIGVAGRQDNDPFSRRLAIVLGIGSAATIFAAIL
ncbi:hypothetical protein [Bosea sp. BK604]|uniref:hypothetical protein n=1 Tax=Bosea sp. BK604 TaxID=2512180 RepID=UPI0010DF2D5E|nr:hypothetical protein [Bosea sp. BK604]TCR69724.1 hypothetical protein EV560_101121 [Bosea sp. BK604]